MDPITALNQEFARLVQADWSREAAERPSEPAAPALRTGAVARLQARLGAGLSAFGMWLKVQVHRADRVLAQRRAQIDQ